MQFYVIYKKIEEFHFRRFQICQYLDNYQHSIFYFDIDSQPSKMNQVLDEFYFRWFWNSFIEIGRSASIPLMFNYLKWNLSKIIEVIKSWQVDNDVIDYDVIIPKISIVNLVKQTLHQRLIQKKLQNQKKMNLMNFWTWDRKNKVIWHRQCLSNDQIRKFMISRNRLIIYTKEKPHLEKILDHQQRKVWNTNPFKHLFHPNLP